MTVAAKARRKKFEREVGRAIKLKRTTKGVSQEALGTEIDYGAQVVSRYESGEVSLSLYNFFLICKALDVPPGHFLSEIIMMSGVN